MEILLTITYSVLFLFIIRKLSFFRLDELSVSSISYIFIVKIIFGCVLWLVYTYYYTDRTTADIYKYFDDSKIMFDALKSKPVHYFKMLTAIGNNTPEFSTYYNEMHFWSRKIDSNIYNDSHTIIRFNAFVRLFSMGYYGVHIVVMCFLSLVGLTAIYKTFIPFLKDKKIELMIAVFLFPSVLFWSSGVLKEGLIFFALGLLVYHSTRLFSIKSLLTCIVMAVLLAFSKFYVWIAIVPSLFFFIWLNYTSRKYLFLKFAVVILGTCLVGLNIDKFTSFQNPLVTLSQKQIEFNKLAMGQLSDANENPIPAANSRIEIPQLEPTFYSFLKNSPQAFINVFCRPFVWELKNKMMIVAGIESNIILLLLITMLFFLKPLKDVQWKYVLFCSSFVFIQFLIIGETTSIIGAMVRYKSIALPFLFITVLFLVDKQKVLNRFTFLKRK